MRRYGLLVSAAAMAALLLSGCATEVPGTPTPGERTQAAPTGSQDRTPQRVLAAPGQCVSGNDPAPVDCGTEHTVEITRAGEFGPELGEDPPQRAAVFGAVFPTCREAARDYLGNAAYDATVLGAWLLWAGPDDWQAGHRWYLCGVAELNGRGEAVPRTGSARGVLAGDGLYDHQLCSATRPSRKGLELVACDEPHSAEAIGVVAMGRPDEKYPAKAEFDAMGRQRCPQLLAGYLRAANRDDVVASWTWPDRANWPHGFTNLTCFAEPAKTVVRPVRGLGTAPLPVP
ncbi:septum formation family protein [Prauserella muralis]|uniref:Septum formation-related domain-containing protein n=1 Tax=Prauserella muralis TaxID=588067 RepID=A0A2V4B8L6_9PSEU|nr:septum formation family protein [Prauserella muralis]PXY31590.1 hypothetical protein BAY60_04270 [Prauserella muralis]TWE14050.1 putative regulator of septum formation [Prauserella muralis]